MIHCVHEGLENLNRLNSTTQRGYPHYAIHVLLLSPSSKTGLDQVGNCSWRFVIWALSETVFSLGGVIREISQMESETTGKLRKPKRG